MHSLDVIGIGTGSQRNVFGSGEMKTGGSTEILMRLKTGSATRKPRNGSGACLEEVTWRRKTTSWSAHQFGFPQWYSNYKRTLDHSTVNGAT